MSYISQYVQSYVQFSYFFYRKAPTFIPTVNLPLFFLFFLSLSLCEPISFGGCSSCAQEINLSWRQESIFFSLQVLHPPILLCPSPLLHPSLLRPRTHVKLIQLLALPALTLEVSPVALTVLLFSSICSTWPPPPRPTGAPHGTSPKVFHHTTVNVKNWCTQNDKKKTCLISTGEWTGAFITHFSVTVVYLAARGRPWRFPGDPYRSILHGS